MKITLAELESIDPAPNANLGEPDEITELEVEE